jgi:hypothetical protein
MSKVYGGYYIPGKNGVRDNTDGKTVQDFMPKSVLQEIFSECGKKAVKTQ